MKPWLPQPATSSGAAAQGLRANASLAAWACAASNEGKRGFTREVLELGPQRWARDHVVPRLAGQGIDTVFIAYPGGQEGPADLRFDMITRAAKHEDPRVQACGDYAAWAEAANEIGRRLQCKVGFYLGTTEGMTLAEVMQECDTINREWSDYVDFVVIDTLASRHGGHTDHIAYHRVSAGKIVGCGEARPVRGRPLYATLYMCFEDKWKRHHGAEGDDQHTPLAALHEQGASVMLIDGPGTLTKAEVDEYRAAGIGICVGVDRVPIVGGAT